MIPSVRPITRIHVSAFDGLRSLWSRRITHASDYSFLQKRLQMPSWNPHCTPHKSPEMVSSAHLCGHISTASPPSAVVSPSRPSVGPFTAPLHRRHRTTVLIFKQVGPPGQGPGSEASTFRENTVTQFGKKSVVTSAHPPVLDIRSD